MRIVKAPRAKWETCWHMLLVWLAVCFGVLAFALALVGIWSESQKIWGTAALFVVAAVVLGIVGGVAEDESDDHDGKPITVPLPWRRRAEDVA